METHTILLLDPVSDSLHRTYTDFEGTTECMLGICRIYEETLRRQKPNLDASDPVTYLLNDLFDFIDKQLKDICCLVYDKVQHSYVPQDKDWIKKMMYNVISDQAKNSSKTS